MIPTSPTQDSSTTPDSDAFSFDENDASPEVKYCYNKARAKRPKRNKSAFILFSIETRAKLKVQYKDDLNSNQMMEKLANLWKELPKKEMERFNLLAKNDKVRYQKELDKFWKENPDEIIQNRTKKNHVKKPCSAYALFLKDIKCEIKAQFPKIKMADVLKKVSERWKLLDDDEKNRYQERSDVEKEIAKAKLEQQFEATQVKFVAPQKKVKKSPSEKPDKPEKKVKKQVKLDVERPKTRLEKKRTAGSEQQIFELMLPLEPVKPIEMPLPILDLKDTPQSNFLSGSTYSSQTQFYSNIGCFQPELPIPSSLLSIPTQLETLTLQPQESKLTITTDNLFPSEQFDKKAGSNANALKFIGKDNSAKLELLDLLNFDQKPSRLNSIELPNKSSVWMDSNRFGSNIDLGDGVKDYAPKVSRSEILNNAIMSALDFRREDEISNSDFFSLGLLKFDV